MSTLYFSRYFRDKGGRAYMECEGYAHLEPDPTHPDGVICDEITLVSYDGSLQAQYAKKRGDIVLSNDENPALYLEYLNWLFVFHMADMQEVLAEAQAAA